MSAPEATLRSTWQQVAGGDHPELLDHLLARHREPHRRYHTATHVMWVLRHIDHIVAAGVPDAVYVPTRSDNEAVSAQLAVDAAGVLGWPTDRAQVVHRLVLATAGHSPTAPDETVLVDADLAILGAEPKDYAAYVQGVRVEYAHVSEADWRVGRAAVLQRFIDAPTLFHTEVFQRERGARARANLAAELAALR
jgi:predicted metal-dependent HD superfamily phosphohydrolase